ncbi:MAG: CDP-alcohol phosphatidyltransferase family protein [Deltaproteobacteria bacterium]|nr:CDP-alcohol phosphatidyltransferase family protein [Deltaproteobacteria bacterium]
MTPAGYLHPRNILTYGSMATGLLAVLAASELGSWHASGALLALSVLLDTFDGRFARLWPRTADERAFGVELDSLSDAVVFGFAPAVCLGLLSDFGPAALAPLVWSAAALAYLSAAVTRLGCDNLHQVGADRFVGLPTTLAGLLLSTLFLARPLPWASALVLAALAAGMLAPLPVPRARGKILVVFGLWILGVLAWHTVEAGRELSAASTVPQVRSTAGPNR